MRKLIIGFSRPNKFKVGSFIIRLFEKTEYSHCFIKWNSTSLDEVLLYHAHSKGGLNFISTQNFIKDHSIVKEYEIELDPLIHKAIQKYCVQKAGSEYGYLQLIGIAYYRLMLFFKRKVSNPFPQGQVCSEIILRIFKHIIRAKIEGIDENVAGPHDIEKVLHKMEAKLIWQKEDLSLKS